MTEIRFTTPSILDIDIEDREGTIVSLDSSPVPVPISGNLVDISPQDPVIVLDAPSDLGN